jgi:two-component system NarL family sensor kinase
MGRRRTAEWTGWTIAAATLASQVGLVWVIAANRDSIPAQVTDFLPQFAALAVVSPVFPALAAVILRQFPRHPIGWILLAATGTILLDAVARVYAIVGLYLEPGRLPGPEWAAWFADWNWVPGVMLLLVFVPLLFPDGTLPSHRWRPVAIGLVVWLVLTTVGYALVPEPLVDFDVTKPVQVPAAYPLSWGMLLIPVAVGISLASVVVRRRRATGDKREQMRWLVWALTIAVPLWTLSMVVGLLGERGWGLVQAVLLLGPVFLIPVAITIAIVKYRLYDIDTLINRTLVYGALTATVLAVYAVVVLTVSGATGSVVEWRWSVLVVAAVAIVAYPLREWLQRRVNRFMYGDRDDPARALSQLSRRISDAVTPQGLLPSTVDAIAQALRVPYVAVTLAGAARPAASWGTRRGEPVAVDLVHQGELVGTLQVGQRSDTEPLSAADVRLLEDVARQVAVAAHAVRLADDLQQSRERLVLAREEERRRLRRDLHDGIGSALAGLALHAGNARKALPDDPDQAQRWVLPLEEGIRAAVDDVRRIVDDLRPPALDELGLGGALRQRAAATYPGAQVVDRINGTPLPAAVEVAAYRIATEALANVARHTHAEHVTVDLTVADQPATLNVEVTDDGPGLPDQISAGVGLRSMRERAAEVGGRCDIGTSSGGGAVVRATLPLAGAPFVEDARDG